MIIRLSPDVPVVWRTPTSLQVGVDSPVLTLTGVTAGEERIIAALHRGTTRQGLDIIGRASTLTTSQVTEFLQRISSALEAPALDEADIAPHKPRATALSIVELNGQGRTVEKLRHHLVAAGLSVAEGLIVAEGLAPRVDAPTPRESAPRDFAVLIGHFVLAPELFGRWLRDDIPHIPIIYGDTTVRIGPVIEPGVSPCLYCLERHRVDEDPAWPAIATQLLGRTSPAETELVAAEATVLATRLILNRVHEGAAAVATSLSLDIRTGELTRREWNRHPECACQSVSSPSASAPVQRGTGRARSSRASLRTATTRGAVACALW